MNQDEDTTAYLGKSEGEQPWNEHSEVIDEVLLRLTRNEAQEV